MTPRTRRNVSSSCKKFYVKRMRVKAIRFVCTRSLLYPGFDNAFVSFYPCVLFPMEKIILVLKFTALGLVCRVKNFALYRPTPGR